MKKILALLCLAALAADPASAQFRFTLKSDVIDLTNSVALPGRVPVPLTTNDTGVEIVNWVTAVSATNLPGEFVLQFRAPMPVGSLMTYDAGPIFYKVGGQWKPLVAVGTNTGRKLQVMPFPSGEMIEAVKITVPARRVPGKPLYRAMLPLAALLPVRVVDVTATASVTVSSAETNSAEVRQTQPWRNQPETDLCSLAFAAFSNSLRSSSFTRIGM